MEKHICYRREIEGNANEHWKKVGGSCENKEAEKPKRTVSFTNKNENEIFNLAFESIHTDSKKSEAIQI